MRTGGSVVVVTAGTAYALTPPFTAAPVPIGRSDHVFPALTAGGVGVWRAQAPLKAPDNRTAVVAPTVAFVAIPGTRATGSATVAIPRDLRPVAELPSGILVINEQSPPGRLRVWRPSADGGSGTFVRTIGIASAVVGWSGDKVAWLAAAGCTSNGECPMHITDAATGVDAVVAPPPGFAGYLPGGAFSPANSQLLGVYVFNPVQQSAAARLVLVSFTATAGQRGRWTPVLVPQADVDWARNGPTAPTSCSAAARERSMTTRSGAPPPLPPNSRLRRATRSRGRPGRHRRRRRVPLEAPTQSRRRGVRPAGPPACRGGRYAGVGRSRRGPSGRSRVRRACP